MPQPHALHRMCHRVAWAALTELWQVSAAQAQEELKMQGARARSEAFMVDRRLVSNLLVQVCDLSCCHNQVQLLAADACGVAVHRVQHWTQG